MNPIKYNEYYIASKNGKSNCIIRSFCKLFHEDYDKIYLELCAIASELNCHSYNDIEVFEMYMKKRNTFPTEYGEDIKISELNLDNGRYIVFCWNKNDFYHMVPIIDNVMYDKDSKSLDLYIIKIYKSLV